MKIRNFTLEDYQQVIVLWKTCELPYKPLGRDSKESIEKELEKGIAHFLLAEQNDRIVGSVLATHDGRKGWINRLAVLPEFRKQGLAASLVYEAERRLQAEGIGIIACLIEDDNPTSLEVFECFGYQEFSGMHYLTKRKHPEV